MLDGVEEKFGIDISSIQAPVSIFWRNQLVASKEQLEQGIVDVSVRQL